MTAMVFGGENEYAVAAVDGAKRWLDVPALAFTRAARARYPWLPDGSGDGLFLANGARMYCDCSHIEYATPEVMNPWDAVRAVLAGERILQDLAAAIARENGKPGKLLVFRTNVDYASRTNTWGAHESYSYRSAHNRPANQLIPHLVTRLIYTGSGGLHPQKSGIHFSVSPRAAYFHDVISGDSTYSRGIWHTRNETLAGNGLNRAHILLGETLCSHLALFLKFGTTALVMAMADAGIDVANAIQLSSPVEALMSVAADPCCRARLRLSAGGRATALDIQRVYLEAAESRASETYMPPWAPEVCRVWRRALSILADSPDLASRYFDWAAKRSLFLHRARRRGFDWETLADWNGLTEQVEQALAAADGIEDCGCRVTTARVAAKEPPVASAIAKFGHHMRRRRLAEERFVEFLQLRDELCEADLRFGQLGNGVFESLDAAGLLDHRVPGIDSIDYLVNNPPVSGRAHRRGQVIRELSGSGDRIRADWDKILDYGGSRTLTLADPTSDAGEWIVHQSPKPGDTPEPIGMPRPDDLESLRLFFTRRRRGVSETSSGGTT